MWFLYVVLVLPLSEAAVIGREVSSQNDTSDSWDPEGISDIEDSLNKEANDFLWSLIAARKPHLERPKRDVEYLKTSLLIEEKGVFRLRSIRPYVTLCASPKDIVFVDVGNTSYSICLSSVDDTPGSASLAEITTLNLTNLIAWYSINPESAVSFLNNGRLYVLVADSGRGDGTDLIQFNLETKELIVDHTVHSKHATAIALWKMKMDGSFHLAIANSDGDKQAADLRAEIYTYNWFGTYFDMYSSIIGYDVRDIEPFHIHSKAYLAVANHRRGKDNYHVDSEIFKYNLDQKKWLSHQKIRTYGAMDWEFFTMGSGLGKVFFLAVANYVEQGKYDINSMIYKFVKDKFVPFQCILSSGATSIASFSDEYKFLLAVANEFAGVILYQYDGWRFVRTSVQFTQNTMSPGVKSVSFHTLRHEEQEKLYLAVSNPSKYGESLYEIDFVHETTLKKWHDESIEWCLDTLEKSEISAAEIPKHMGNIYYTDQLDEIVVNGSVFFKNGLEASKLKTRKMSRINNILINLPEVKGKIPQSISTTSHALKLIDLRDGKTYDDGPLLKLIDLQNRITLVEQKMKEISSVLRDAVTLNGNQILMGNYTFEDSTIVCQNECHFHAINTDVLNGDNISNLNENVVFLDQDDFINDLLNIESIHAPSINVLGLIDGINVSNIVTKSGNHIITGVKNFVNPITTGRVEVAGLINDVKVSPKTVLVSGIYQNITGDLMFFDLNTSSLQVNDNVNGVNLNELYRDVVLSGKSYIVTGKKTFSDIEVESIVMADNSTINGVDLNDLWSNVLWESGYQEVRAPMTFSTMVLENDLLVSGTINGLKIPGDDLLLLNSDASILTPLTFAEDVVANIVDITQSINGIQALKRGSNYELDILLTDIPQSIIGTKTFKEIFLDSDSAVSGTVDGIDLSEFKEATLHKNSSQVPNRYWIFNNLNVLGRITVHGLTANSNLNDVYDSAVKLNEPVMPEFESFEFKGPVSVYDLHTDDINDLDVTRDLVLRDVPQTIKGKKSFHDVMLEDNSRVLGLVNNVNLSFLNEVVLKIGDQIINAPTTLLGDVKVKELNVNGTINDIGLSEVVRLDELHVIGHKTLVDSKFEGQLFVKDINVKSINGVDVEELLKDTMTYDGEQVVTGIKFVNGRITISESSNLQTDSLNGIDVSELWNDAVRRDIPQTIFGKKVFLDAVNFGDLTFHSSIDGVTEWDVKHNWLYRDGDQEIFSDVIFTSGLTVKQLDTGLINGIDIIHLNNSIVKTNEASFITGLVIFDSQVVSSGDITLHGKIQGLDLSEEAVLLNEKTTVTGNKEFAGNVRIYGDLTVGGLINGISVEEMCENVILLKSSSRLHSLTVEGNVVFKQNISVGGMVSGIDIGRLKSLSVKTADGNIFLTDLKAFESLTIDGPVKIDGYFGKVDLSYVNSTFMSVSREQLIPSSLRFDEMEVKGGMSVDNFYSHDNKINNIDIVELEKNVLKVNGPQTVTESHRFDAVIFEDLIVAGKVNNIEIPAGLMLRNKTNHVYHSKVFEDDLNILGDLTMESDKTIQDVDVSEWYQKTVFRGEGIYQIKGVKTFQNVTFNDVTANRVIDNVKISNDSLLLIYGDQTITGQKFVANVTVLGNLAVDGLINKLNLSDLSVRAARMDKENTITGIKSFTKPLTVGRLSTILVNGVDILQLDKMINSQLAMGNVEKQLVELKQVMSETTEDLHRSTIALHYYELHQGFNIPNAYSWLYVAGVGDSDLLLLSDFSQVNGCTTIKSFEYDEEDNKFVQTEKDLKSAMAVAMTSVRVRHTTYLFVANQMQNMDCISMPPSFETGSGRTPGLIYKWDDEQNTFNLHQVIKMQPATDVAVFVKDGTNQKCVIYAGVNAQVYCATDEKFELRETLTGSNILKVGVLENDYGITMLAVARFNPRSTEGAVDFYQWDELSGLFGEPAQTIQCSYPQTLMFMMHTSAVTQHFLVISEGSIPNVNNVPRLLIYSYNFHRTPKLSMYQEFEDSGDLEWMILPNKDLIFYVLNNKMSRINIYKYKYASGFVKTDTIHSSGYKLHAFNRREDNGNHYLAIAGPQRNLPLSYEDSEYAKILLSKIK